MRNPFRCFYSSPEVIRLAVMMYVRYPLSHHEGQVLPTAFQGASRRFVPHLGRRLRHRMTPVARYSHRD